MRPLLLLGVLFLTACGIREAGPEDAYFSLLWWLGLTAGAFLLSASVWLLDGVLDRHRRRADRRDDRGVLNP